MPDSLHDDPTVPPPGKRSGAGVSSIFPYLKRSLATKLQMPSQGDDISTVPQPDPPPRRGKTNPRSGN